MAPPTKKLDLARQEAVFSDTGHRRTFAVVVKLSPDMDILRAETIADEVIGNAMAHAIHLKKKPITGIMVVGYTRVMTIDNQASKARTVRSPVIEFTGTVNVHDPLEAKVDKAVFVRLRDLFMLLGRALGNLDGSVTLGAHTWVAEITDHHVTVEGTRTDIPDPHPEITRPSGPKVDLSGDEREDILN